MIRMEASDRRSSTDIMSTGWQKIPSVIIILGVSVEVGIWEMGGR